MYDVIVVGSGPGGSTAAIHARHHNLRTLLIDRDAFPRDKACGDAVGLLAYDELQKIIGNDLDPNRFHTVRGVRISTSNHRGVKVPLSEDSLGKVHIIPRYEFDHVLHQTALACGCEHLIANVMEPICADEQVVGVRTRINDDIQENFAKVVIGADGASSVISRKLSSYRAHEKLQAVAVRGYVRTEHQLDGTVEFALLSELPGGYAWFFPTGSHQANVGIGMRSDLYKQHEGTLQDLLHAYVQKSDIAERVGNHKVTGIKSWQLGLFDADRPRVFNGAILIGDAGGFIDPLTGAGIFTAMITGRFAADTAARAIEADDFSQSMLSHYDQLWRSTIYKRLRRSTRFHQCFVNAPHLVDLALNFARVFPGILPLFVGKV